ncbi:hypothetical protein O181_129765, partial [Austropuccinia psidii MF-1]|nr:hypothetical protein [Austropuccinia psidii MF-1]
PTLETQDRAPTLSLIEREGPNDDLEGDSTELATVVRPPGNRTIVKQLRDLCSHIRGSTKQRELFIQARNKTRDPKLLPISIPMTRWNYFLLQIRRAHKLKLSIQIYTNKPPASKYELSEETWCAMEYMEPILSMFEQACNIFQSNNPTKHLVLPYYHVILNRLIHYAELGINTDRSQHIIGRLLDECHGIMVQTGFTEEDSMIQPPSNDASDQESIDLLKHFNQTPLVASYNVNNPQGDEVILYIQNLHPITKGEHILDYWKRQIVAGNFPNLGRLAQKYLSIHASSAVVERVFSHSGRLKCPTRASLGSRTIAHLTCLKEWLNSGPV